MFRWKHVKPQSRATAKHNFQRLVFNPANQNLVDFPDELQKLAQDAFGVAAQSILEHLIYAKMPPHTKKSINEVHLEHSIHEQIVSHPERELELNGLEAPKELQINTVTQQTTQQKPEKHKTNCHYAKSQVTFETSAVNSNEKKTKPETTQKMLAITTTKILVKQFLTPPIKIPSMPTQTEQIVKKTKNPDLSTHPVRPVVKLTIPQKFATLEQTQRTDRNPRTVDRKDKIKSNREIPKATQIAVFKLQPKRWTRSASSSL